MPKKGSKKRQKKSTTKSAAKRPSKAVRKVYLMAKKKSSKSKARGFLGGGKSLLSKALLGLGAASLGTIVASKIGVNPLLVSTGVGFLAGGPIGAIAAIGVPMLANQLGGQSGATQQVSGQVWM